ncbi:winged helix-turn-helix domain-containing protein [Leptospira interrogans serovar Canicola]|uniref:Winged helix-turn-helix domain-containing protein n=1 Tax=Leptospira interrogans serovar Canicola TaxID=211880 RepID=A0AAP9WDX1_LEPIR|nr:winged helix-turn-helix domain-containing protein [Leptospira interrogans]QOI43355.1 winged helix-turn-helix domain-containing protein [Leptospira interrogans serovar Canicola]
MKRKALRGDTLLELLKVFLENPGLSFSRKVLQKKIRKTVRTTNYNLNRLMKSGIIRREGSILYTLSERYYLKFVNNGGRRI